MLNHPNGWEGLAQTLTTIPVPNIVADALPGLITAVVVGLLVTAVGTWHRVGLLVDQIRAVQSDVAVLSTRVATLSEGQSELRGRLDSSRRPGG